MAIYNHFNIDNGVGFLYKEMWWLSLPEEEGLCFLPSASVISCQYLELDYVIGSFAALDSLKLSIWDLDLRRVPQSDRRGNTQLTAVLEPSGDNQHCTNEHRQLRQLRSLLGPALTSSSDWSHCVSRFSSTTDKCHILYQCISFNTGPGFQLSLSREEIFSPTHSACVLWIARESAVPILDSSDIREPLCKKCWDRRLVLDSDL